MIDTLSRPGVEFVWGPPGQLNRMSLLAIVVRAGAVLGSGLEFITDRREAFQLGLMAHSKGHKIPPHYHSLVRREVLGTSEALIVRKGSAVVRFYEVWNCPFEVNAITVERGDLLVLISGGHGFEVLEDFEAVEIKQGPYIDAVTDKVIIEEP